MSFDKAFDRTIGHEGGFTDNRADRGNWTSGVIGTGQLKGTKFGISAMSYPDLDIKNLTVAQAKEIYKRDFWDKPGLNKLPEVLSADVFDMGVNAGLKTAVKLVQRAVGVTDDGIMGPKTLQAVTDARSHGEDDYVLYTQFCAERIKYYTSLSTFSTFGKGWMNRVATCMLLTAKDN